MCWQHAPGLLKHASDTKRYLAALEQCKPGRVQLSVLTMPEPIPLAEQPCTGGYLCECPSCNETKAAQRSRDVRQPWEAKAA